MNDNEIMTALQYVSFALKEAIKYGLEDEIVYFALSNMKSDPQLTIEQALHDACSDWDVY